MRDSLNKDNYDSVNLYFQDETRFGLMTKQKRVLVSKGIKPIGQYQHSYKWLWLWGCFSPINGQSFYWETPLVSNSIFEGFLDAFSKQNPKEFKIIIMDNAGFHACQNIIIPKNIKLIRIPPYTPELNPAEKVWQWMKSKTAMKLFNDMERLQEKITEMVNQLNPKLIKSIAANSLFSKMFFEYF
ncbi:IS630 family transposase [Flavivirga rizhaonensis]|uniref:IS630 family transposase n=1 Tax=Flavivirga rizhaonensis TaxID=2559571 RepID=A0A4S1DQP7_9FLAO|nr:IS630 family transposase [Flavivirga rizhaonensis]